MQKLIITILSLLYLPQAKTQSILGLWQGSLFNDSTGGYYFYEVKIDSSARGISAVTRTQFIVNDESYFSVKKATVKNIKGRWVIKDAETLSSNAPVAQPKGILQLNILTQKGDSLLGPFATNTTKKYSEVTGYIRLQKNGGNVLTDLSAAMLPNTPIPQKQNILPVSVKQTTVAERKNVLQATIEFSTDSVQLLLYDNGEIDGDTVSVYMNNEVFISKAGLGLKPVRKTLYITKDQDSLLLVMFAETLGTLPPNTGLLIIMDGSKRNELRFSGDLQTNAAILLKRKKLLHAGTGN